MLLRRIALFLVVLFLAAAVALRFVRGSDTPVIAGGWRELRPPEFE